MRGALWSMVVLAACAPASPSPPAVPSAPADLALHPSVAACRYELSDLRDDIARPTYDARVAALPKLVRGPLVECPGDTAKRDAIFVLGHRGAARFLLETDGVGSSATYFDASGAVVAAEVAADIALYGCDGARSSRAQFGVIPDGEAIVDRSLCPGS